MPKKSNFITDSEVPDGHFFDTFGNGVNRKISKENLFAQIKSESLQTYYYDSEDDLKAADLEADPDNPIYVRVAPAWRLYRITSLAPVSPYDIALNNGATATLDRLENLQFINVQDMKDAPYLKEGDLVEFIGYYTPGDGGGNKCEIGTGFGTADGGSVIDLPGSGLQARGLFPGAIINVRQFGAIGDGSSDDTASIQAAIDASNAAKIDLQVTSLPEIGSRSIVQPVVFLPAGEYRITSSLLLFQATGSWTSINVTGEEGLGAFLIADDGGGGVSQAFDIISGDNAAAFPGYQSSIRNIHFIGGRHHIRLVSASINQRKIHIKGCSHSWNDPTVHAIHIDARSTYLHIEDPRVMGCPRYLYLNHVDRAQLDGGWVNGYIDQTTGKPADSASISLNGKISEGPSRLAIRGTLFTPEPQGVTQNALTRWIDLNDDCAVDIRDAHFGLENAGFPIVFVNTPLDSVSVSPFHSDARVTMDCVTGGSGSASRVDRGLVVLREGVPHITSLKNVSRVGGGILINAANMINGVGTPITLAAYLASLSGSNRPMLSVTIDGVMAWDTQDVPLELRKYTSGNIPVSHPSGTFPSSSIQPASRVNGFLTSAIPDDGTLTVSFPAQFGLMIITADDGGSSSSNRVGSSVAVAYSSQAASAVVQTLWDGTFGDVAALDTDLTGTTGVNGNFTLSVKQGRVFELENRLGFSCQFRILFLNTQEF